MYQNAPHKMTSEQTFFTLKLANLAKRVLVNKREKLVEHFTFKAQIFSDKPEILQQEKKEKKKERKIGGKIITYLIFKLLNVKRMQNK